MWELLSSLSEGDKDSNVRSFIVTGGEKVFAAGADIKEMKDLSYIEVLSKTFLKAWDDISMIKKPIIAAVNGYALGGGFEVALMCDMIVASKSAKFGLPELKLGTIPGMGGT
jgi:enoyl-CoA hydratase/carnithine racemase